MEPRINKRIDTNHIHGYIKYIGPLEGKKGTWVGILLDKEEGKNDGTYNNVRYFDCGGKKSGIFVDFDKAFVKSGSEYMDKYRKALIHSKAKENVLENRFDEKISEYKELVNGKDREIDMLKCKIIELTDKKEDGCTKKNLRDRIERIGLEISRLGEEVRNAQNCIAINQKVNYKATNGKRDVYRKALLKLFDSINNDDLFTTQYNTFMNM